MHKYWRYLSVLIIVFVLFSACASAPEPAPDVVGEEAAVEEVKADLPTELNIASIHSVTMEVPWARNWLESWGRVAEDNPYGLTINFDDYTEEVWGDDAERILREYAETGKYQIIWAHSSYTDQVRNLMTEFPEILWATTGSGNEPIGGNAYLTYEHGHEGAYLLGIIAGIMTETNLIGFVGGFPADDVNDAANGFIDGAKSVNPDVEARVSFIESWYDPPKAKEATLAQIAAGADFVYAERLGVFEACSEKGILCFGHFEDQNYMQPDAVLSSTTINWEPAIRYILDVWWANVAEGEAYDAPMEQIWFSMAEGGVGVADFHDLEGEVSEEALAAFEAAQAEILSGDLVVPLKTDIPVSD